LVGFPGQEVIEGIVAGVVYGVDVVHGGAAEFAVVEGKAARFDDFYIEIKAGGSAKDGADILGDVWLV